MACGSEVRGEHSQKCKWEDFEEGAEEGLRKRFGKDEGKAVDYYAKVEDKRCYRGLLSGYRYTRPSSPET